MELAGGLRRLRAMQKDEEDDLWCWGVIGAVAIAAGAAVWVPILILA